MQFRRCMSDAIVRVPTKTHVTVLLHRMEQYKTSNTGFLATLALPNSAVHVHDDPLTLQPDTYVLFPSEDAVPLPTDRPIRRIEPDATWQQSRRMVRRNDALASAPKATLPMGLISQYGLRKRKRGIVKVRGPDATPKKADRGRLHRRRALGTSRLGA